MKTSPPQIDLFTTPETEAAHSMNGVLVPSILAPDIFQIISIAEVLADIKNERYKPEIDALPSATTDKKAYTEAKRHLPSWALNGVFTGKVTNGGYTTTNGLFHIDIDGIEDPHALKWQLAREIPEIYALWLSPSGLGLKGLIRIPDDLIHTDCDFKKAFAQIAQYLTVYDVTIDKACKDVRRLCFVGSDADIYINTDAPAFIFDSVQWATKPTKPATTKPATQNQQTCTTTDRYISRCCELILNAGAGNYHNSRLRAGKLAGGFIAAGLVNETEVMRALSDASDTISTQCSDNPQVIQREQKTIYDAIQHGKSLPVQADSSNRLTSYEDTLYIADIVQNRTRTARENAAFSSHNAILDTEKPKTEPVTAEYFNTDRGLSAGYPSADLLPCYRVYDDWFKVDDNTTLKPGTYLHHAKKDNDGLIVGIFNSRMCSPLYIESVTLDQHHGNYGRFLRFKPTRGGFKKWCMPMALLGGSLDVLKSELLSRGVLLDFDNLKLLPRYFHHFIPKETLEVATQTGWHKGAYILPESCIGSDNFFYQSENIHTDVPYRQSGLVTDWQNQIGRYCVGNPLLMLSVCCAFTGALLKPSNQQGGGFHFVGESSKGKSTGLEVACSVHGDGTYKRTWKATGNGMEATAAMFNDGFLALDEIGECNPKEVGNIIYQVANGVGKSRANRNGGAKASYQWRVIVLSNGEVSIESAMQEAGQRVKAGQLMRLLNIPIFGKYGAFNELHDMKDGRALADHLKTASLKFYGAAGIEYLTKLVKETRDIAELAELYTVALIDNETLSSQESRAAKRFALVALAGELATGYGITGWKKGDACHGVKECFNQWRKSFGGGDTEDRQIKEAVQAYVEMYGDARFTSISTNNDRLHGVRSGYWKDNPNGRVWMFNKSGLMEAVKGYDLKKAADVLKQCGWLILDGQGKSTTVTRIKSELTRLYVICFDGAGVTPVTPVTPVTLSGVTVEATNGAGVTPVTPVTPKNTNIQSETDKKINRGRI
jgi:putative DNA primase/helicase